jgi:hypothetical protein
MGNLLGRILGVIFTTFLVAALYGLFCTTVDFMNPKYDPVASGRRAAHSVYGLFGVVSEEIEHNDPQASPRTVTIAERIATPYAVTADLAGLLGGKLELGLSSLFHGAVTAADKVAPAQNTNSEPITSAPAR